MHSNATKVRYVRGQDEDRIPGRIRRVATSGERIRVRVALATGQWEAIA